MFFSKWGRVMKKQLSTTTAAVALLLGLAAAPGTSAFAMAKPNHHDGNHHGDYDGHGSHNEASEPGEFSFVGQWGNIDPFYGHIDPFYGNINPFYGDINPFYGDISPFWGDISPFWGDINPFYGNIDPFYGNIDPFWGNIDPFWGNIDPFYTLDDFHASVGPFWGDIGPFWGDINAFWGNIDPFTGEASANYQLVASDLQSLFDQAEAVFGAEVLDDTGQSFEAGFLNDLLARYGIDLNDPESLGNLSEADRSMFFIDFYDGLMAFTDADRVDHWMATINWTPAISQAAGGGAGVSVGVVDFSVPKSSDFKTSGKGSKHYLDVNHGLAVAGLIAAPHDGVGVMGIAPDADISLVNPFDESLTASWEDVADSLDYFLHKNEKKRADIINLSIGVDGWTFHPDWQNVFAGDVAERGVDTLFVFAAGNAGVAQAEDVDWSLVGSVENLLIVGSVNPNGGISPFSNTPGTACFTLDGACADGNRLMDRFLVAPGELILVGDGEDGDELVRMSGTSFAAPMVSGAAALVSGQWPWLEASDIADVLLWSATDLGEEGVDEVYGWGLLNVDAAMSPLSGDELFYFSSEQQAQAVDGLALILNQVQLNPSSEDSVVVFEVLNDTFRDFEFSLSELIQTGESDSAAPDWSAAYNAERIYSAANGASFTDTGVLQSAMALNGSVMITAFASPADPMSQRSEERLSYQTGVQIADLETGNHIAFGVGEGALAINGDTGFGLFSDHRPDTGGVNPILGLASGGAFGVMGLSVGENRTLSLAVTNAQEELVFDNPITGEQSALVQGLQGYMATALTAKLTQGFGETTNISFGYTLLNEAHGFLGAQGAGLFDMDQGSLTDAVTIGAQHAVSDRVALNASATMARTHDGALAGQTLRVSDETLSTAYQLSAHIHQIVGKNDGVRFSLIQPLHIETGSLEYSTLRVVDRQTGELAMSQQTWELGGDRSLQLEMLYATTLFEGQVELSAFNRFELNEARMGVGEETLASGVRLQVDF